MENEYAEIIIVSLYIDLVNLSSRGIGFVEAPRGLYGHPVDVLGSILLEGRSCATVPARGGLLEYRKGGKGAGRDLRAFFSRAETMRRCCAAFARASTDMHRSVSRLYITDRNAHWLRILQYRF